MSEDLNNRLRNVGNLLGICDQGNIAGFDSAREDEEFSIWRPIENLYAMRLVARQLLCFASIKRLNPDVRYTTDVVDISDSFTIRRPGRPGRVYQKELRVFSSGEHAPFTAVQIGNQLLSRARRLPYVSQTRGMIFFRPLEYASRFSIVSL